jgi:hypothetical protein
MVTLGSESAQIPLVFIILVILLRGGRRGCVHRLFRLDNIKL